MVLVFCYIGAKCAVFLASWKEELNFWKEALPNLLQLSSHCGLILVVLYIEDFFK